MKKRMCVIALLCLSVFGSALGGTGCASKPAKVALQLWSMVNTVRVLQDKGYAAPERGEPGLSILAVRNEREGAQLIFTPESEVNGYTLETSDLKSANGKTFGKQNFSVYHQMYLPVETVSEVFSTGLGNYPDPLLPLDVANRYGETKVPAGGNQGVTVIAEVPENQAAGIYKGAFTLKVNGEDNGHSVPVSVEVFDYTLENAATAKSCFSISRHYMAYYGDSTLENYALYYEYLVARRVMPMYLPVIKDPFAEFTDDDLKAYADAAIEYGAREEISSFGLPYSLTYSTEYGTQDVDWVKMKQIVRLAAEKSIESGVNAVEKCYFYFGTLTDEPTANGTVDLAIRVCNDFEKALTEIADELAQDSGLTGDNKAEVIASVRAVPCLQTEGEYIEKMHNDGKGVRNWCSQFNGYDTAAKRARFAELAQSEEQWWYGCIIPNNPYPTYQIDDHLISSRVLSWMQKDYKVSGNLYWETVLWKQHPTNEKKDLYHDNPMNYPNDNGDGTLLYPGDPYGIEGPVGCIRLESIADGLEEYEILAGIEKDYAALGLNAEAVLQTFYKKLYADAMMRTTGEEFMPIRRNMYETAVLARNYGVFIKDVKEDTSKITYTVVAADGVGLVANGTALTNGSDAGPGYKEYTAEVAMTQARNRFSLTATKDGKKAALDIGLGGKKELINGFETEADLIGVTADGGAVSLADGTGLGFGSNALKADFIGGEDAAQFVYIATDKVQSIAAAEKLTLTVYAEKGVSLQVFVSVRGRPVMLPIGSAILKSGLQSVELVGLDKLSLGTIERLALQFGSRGDDGRIVYIDDIAVQG